MKAIIEYEMFPRVFTLRKEINEFLFFEGAAEEVELSDDVEDDDKFFDLIGSFSFEQICAIMLNFVV